MAFDGAVRRCAGGNQYGVEGSGLWLHLQTITDRVRARGEVLGHAVAVIIPGGVIVLIAIAVQAVVRDDLDKIPAAIGLSFAALLGGTAVACYLSARVPYAQPQSRKSMFASSVPGQKGRTFAATPRPDRRRSGGGHPGRGCRHPVADRRVRSGDGWR